MFFKNLLWQIQNAIARWKLGGYGLRPALVSDLDFIMMAVVEDARQGHYIASLLERQQQISFREQLENVIKYSAMLRRSERGVEQIAARLWVYGKENDDQVGYMLVAEKVPGSIQTDVELYKCGVTKNRRQAGHGKKMVRIFIQLSPKTTVLYARCLKPSDWMYKLLLDMNFKLIDTLPLGTRVLELRQI